MRITVDLNNKREKDRGPSAASELLMSTGAV